MSIMPPSNTCLGGVIPRHKGKDITVFSGPANLLYFSKEVSDRMSITRELPIAICPELIKPTLEGRKTMTRRLVNPQPPEWATKLWGTVPCKKGGIGAVFEGYYNEEITVWPDIVTESILSNATPGHVCSHYRVGDILWVKETYCHGIEWDDSKPSEVDPLCGGNDIWYLADGPRPTEGWGKTRSSRFMCKWITRTRLRVTKVKPLERIQEISYDDIIEEGWDCRKGPFIEDETAGEAAYRWFRKLWDTLHGKDAWERNDWVWPIEWEKIK